MEFKESKWWMLLPIVVMFVCYYVGYNSLPEEPESVWWGIPLYITLILTFLYSVVSAIVLWPSDNTIG